MNYPVKVIRRLYIQYVLLDSHKACHGKHHVFCEFLCRDKNVSKVPHFSSRERERESQIQVGICYHQQVFPTVANTQWVFSTVENTHQ